MKSNELRSSEALLGWLRALTLAAGTIGCAACASGTEATVIKTPIRTPTKIIRGNLDSHECRRLCNFDSEEPTPYRCELVTVQIAPGVSNTEAAASTKEELAVLCATYLRKHTPFYKSFGRRPAGVGELPLSTSTATAAEHYARAAYLETAAILSFQQLAFDLQALRAPASLIREARQAARDEARHARVSLRLARRFAAGQELEPWPRWSWPRWSWPRWPRPARRVPSLFDVALENATGGCVNETFGTWLQLHQAEHAPEPELRAVAAQIARDEAAHAAHAFRVFDFFDRSLTPEERRAIRVAMRQELENCANSAELANALAVELGLPGRSEARRIAQQLEGVLLPSAA